MARRLLVVVVSLLLAAAGTAAAAPMTKAQPKAMNAKLDAKHALAVKAAYLKVKTARSVLALSAVQKSNAAALEKKLTATQRAARARVGVRLLAAVHASRKSKNELVLPKAQAKAIESDLKLLGSKDANALIALALQATVDAQSEVLQKAAKAAEDRLARTARLRESITALREVLADWSKKSQSVSWTEADGTEHTKVLTKTEVIALLERLESELKTMAAASELANLDLQATMQKQQQVLQTISNIMKSMHDTLKTIINNLK